MESLSTQENFRMRELYCLPDRLPYRELGMGIAEGGLLCMGLAWLFYRSLIPGCILLPFFLKYYLRRKTNQFVQKRKLQFRGDFKDFTQMLSSFLLAGYSVENAMKKAFSQMKQIQNGHEELKEMLSCMLREIQIGENTELVWMRFCQQIPIEEVRDFGQIFSLSKRSGASLPDVLSRVVKQLDLKIQTEEQIETLIAGKKTEQKVMNVMPAGILVYICITSEDMMRIMYTSLSGRMVMSICLIVYLAAFWMSEQILSSL